MNRPHALAFATILSLLASFDLRSDVIDWTDVRYTQNFVVQPPVALYEAWEIIERFESETAGKPSLIKEVVLESIRLASSNIRYSLGRGQSASPSQKYPLSDFENIHLFAPGTAMDCTRAIMRAWELAVKRFTSESSLSHDEWHTLFTTLKSSISTESLAKGIYPSSVKRDTVRSHSSVQSDHERKVLSIDGYPGTMLYFYEPSTKKRHAVMVVNPRTCLTVEVSVNSSYAQKGDASRFLRIPSCNNGRFYAYPSAKRDIPFHGSFHLKAFEEEWKTAGYTQ